MFVSLQPLASPLSCSATLSRCSCKATTPLFTALLNPRQTIENTATLSLALAALMHSVPPKSFICCSYTESPGATYLSPFRRSPSSPRNQSSGTLLHFFALYCTPRKSIPCVSNNLCFLLKKTPGVGCLGASPLLPYPIRRSSHRPAAALFTTHCSLFTLFRPIAPHPAKCQNFPVAFFATRDPPGQPPGNKSAPSGV